MLGIGLIVAEATSVCGQPRHAWLFPGALPLTLALSPACGGEGMTACLRPQYVIVILKLCT